MVFSPSSLWFNFENDYPHEEVHKWMIKNRFLSLVMGGIYVALLYIGRNYMKNRPPFSARLALALWNLFMSAFSLAITIRIAPYFLKRTFTTPFFDQMCEIEYNPKANTSLREPMAFWIDLFVLTKPIEFIDTLFIVLRKQHLHFLHWYHHITVVVLCWYSLGTVTPPPNAIFYVEMNAFVHSCMYVYYFLRSVKMRVPRMAQMTITVLQIAQMVVGIIINVAPLIYRLNGVTNCDAQWESIGLALGIYFTYLLLFAEFFYKAYFSKKPVPASNGKICHGNGQANGHVTNGSCPKEANGVVLASNGVKLANGTKGKVE